jgi:DNA (cytosine-5)-methyltransferase 1
MTKLRRTARVTVGDLFAGAGLFSKAFADSGADIRFAIELDPLAARSYAHNVGDHVHIGSVAEVRPAKIVDVIVAGPPCQGFSTLGRRDPKDVRNRLCMTIPKWADACRARVVVVENVPPFLQSPSWAKMRRELCRRGFDVAAWTLDSADFGSPQRRRRSFTIASKIGIPSSPMPSGVGLAGLAFGRIRSDDSMHIWPKNSELANARMKAVPPNGDRRDIVRTRPGLCPPSWFSIGCQATDVYGRININAPANTIRCDFQNPSKGRYLHPTDDRVISLREGARLQQIPDDWVLFGHRTAITRQIGNGVPLGLGKAVAMQVLSLFD